MSTEEVARSAGRILTGATVVFVGRAAGAGVVEVTGPSGEGVALHVQCPFRVLDVGQVLLSDGDLGHPARGAGADAFDRFETAFDARAALLNRVLGEVHAVVSSVRMRDGGSCRWSGSPGSGWSSSPTV